MSHGVSGLALATAFALASVVQATDEEITVYFTSQRSVSISVYVDGSLICQLATGANCSTPMSGDGEREHPVHVVSVNQSYDDAFDLDECWGDDEGYTFSDAKAQFHCADDEDD